MCTKVLLEIEIPIFNLFSPSTLSNYKVLFKFDLWIKNNDKYSNFSVKHTKTTLYQTEGILLYLVPLLYVVVIL